MCNQGTEILSETELESECPTTIQQEEQHQLVLFMDSPTLSPGSVLSSNDDNPRVKFLCSFLGSILPRPHDGKLRYVGGETRIVSVPRDITYEELMSKMRELFEGAAILKYQQPDEDLDALVSVVNDDDVTNMMEEYDKLGTGDGFTRLRIFLFSHSDQDGPMHFVDGDERDNERRYVDALNSLNESPEYRRNQGGENQFMGTLEDAHAVIAEQFLNQISLDSTLHNQRNAEIPMPPLRQLNIPSLVSAQSQQSVTQRYNEMEAPWSPAYYSPRQAGHHDPRQVAEYPTSPSSSRYRTQYAEFPDKSFAGMAEEYNRNPMNHQPLYEPQQQFTDNVSMFPTGTVLGDKAGFPGNIMHGTHVVDTNSICEHCRVTFQRNQAYSESPWKHGEHHHLEPPSIGNGFHHVGNLCAECPPNREMFVLSTDANVHQPYYLVDHNEPRNLYSENQSHERSWTLQHQSTARPEELRPHASGAGRLTDHYVGDSNMNVSHGPVNVSDSHYLPSHYVQHDDPRYIRATSEASSQVFHDPTYAAASHIHVQPIDERGVRYGNSSYAYGADNIYQVTHGHAPAPAATHTLWRNSHIPVPGGLPYEASSSPQIANGLINPGLIRVEGSPRLPVGLDNQNPWVDSSQKITVPDGTSLPECSNAPARQPPTVHNKENQFLYKPSLIPHQGDVLNISTQMDPLLRPDLAVQTVEKVVTTPQTRNEILSVTEQARTENSGNGGDKLVIHEGKLEDSNIGVPGHPEQNSGVSESPESGNSNYTVPAIKSSGIAKAENGHVSDPQEKEELNDDHLGQLPELIASVKEAAVENVIEVKSEHNTDRVLEHDAAIKEEHQNETEAVVSYHHLLHLM